MNVVIYIRVSTKLQETKFSLSAQKEELVKYAKQQKWKIIDIIQEVDSGGKFDKKGLNQLLDLIEEGKVDVVLCMDQDRLSRLDTIAWELLKQTLRENNVKIAEPGHVVDLSNEDEEFVSDIKNLIAKREKRFIVKRMMRGKRQRLREGKGWGKPPFEYTYNKLENKYEINEKWTWDKPYIDKLYLEDHLGMKAIADKLNAICKTPTGNYWNETIIKRRLISKAFHGVMEKTFSNGETISINGIYPPLRSEETWKKIQMERNKRASVFKADFRNSENIHMLRKTYISCGHCGRKIQVTNNGKTNQVRYYLKHGRKLSIKDRTVCNISINTERVDNNILTAIKDILSSEQQAKNYIQLETNDEDILELKENISNIQITLNSYKEKKDKVIDLYLEGLLTKELLVKKQNELENMIELHADKLNQLKTKLHMLEKNKWDYELIYQFLEIAEGIEYELTPNERVGLVATLFPSATLYEDRIILIGNLEHGVPVEINIPVAADAHTWHHTKKAENN